MPREDLGKLGALKKPEKKMEKMKTTQWEKMIRFRTWIHGRTIEILRHPRLRCPDLIVTDATSRSEHSLRTPTKHTAAFRCEYKCRRDSVVAICSIRRNSRAMNSRPELFEVAHVEAMAGGWHIEATRLMSASVAIRLGRPCAATGQNYPDVSPYHPNGAWLLRTGHALASRAGTTTSRRNQFESCDLSSVVNDALCSNEAGSETPESIRTTIPVWAGSSTSLPFFATTYAEPPTSPITVPRTMRLKTVPTSDPPAVPIATSSTSVFRSCLSSTTTPSTVEGSFRSFPCQHRCCKW